MKSIGLRAGVVLAALVAAASIACGATINWSSNGLTDNWSEGENWDALAPPGTADTATFGDVGAVADDSVTNIVDQAFSIGGLDVTATAGNHKISLNGNTLLIDGRVDVGYRSLTKTTRIVNGTLQIGTEAAARDMYIGGSGNWQDYEGFIGSAYLLISGVSLSAYLNDWCVGYGNWINIPIATVDLQGATAPVLRTNTLTVGTGNPGSYGAIKLSSSMGLTDFRIKRAMTLAITAGTAQIGDPGNSWKLPPGVSLTFGDWGTTRCDVEIGRGNNDYTTDGRIVASSGGTLTAYWGAVKLAQHQGTNQSYGEAGSSTATLDFSAMSSATVDATNIEISALPPMATPGGHNDGRGLLSLPAGTATVGSIIVAHPDVNDTNADPTMKGELRLNGTVFTVTGSMTVGPRGTVTATIKGSPAGLDLASEATLADTGKIHIVFQQADPNPAELYWGLRWAGNHQTDLLGLKNDGKLTWDDTPIGGGVNIVYMADSDTTYVAVAAVTGNLPPVARVKNAAKGFDPAMGETGVTFAVADVDNGSYDPDGVDDVIDLRISCADDTETPDDPHTVTLTAAGDYTVTLTIEDTQHQVGTADCTVTVFTPQPTQASLTWAAGAGDDKLEWKWARNWVGLNPPENPTAGTLTFDNDGAVIDDAVTNIMDQPWTVGGLAYSATAGNHKTDLGGRALVVDGRMAIGLQTVTKVTRIVNGSLQIGTEGGLLRDLQVGGTGDYQTPTGGGELILSNVALSAFLNQCLVGYGNSTNSPVGILDLQEAAMTTLAANSLIIGTGNPPASGSIKLSASTGLTDIKVLDTVLLGQAGGIGRIGDPTNEWKLPPNVNLTLGELGLARCNVTLGAITNPDAGTDARIVASSGGTCAASIDALKIAQHQGGSLSLAEAGYSIGILDLSAMDSVSMDATSIEIAAQPPVASPGGHNDGRGLLALPAGTVTVGTVVVAHPDVDSTSADPTMKGELKLNGTLFSVATSMTVGPRGSVTATLKGAPAGIDLASGDALTIKTGGSVNLVFEQPDPNPAELYWGLRWAGNHMADLLLFKNDGRLTIDDLAIGGGVNIVYNEIDDTTYVAVAAASDNLPPVARVKNASKLFDPDSGETGVTFVVADVDNGSFDPDGPDDVADISVSCPADTELPDDPHTVTFTAAGDYTVTLAILDNHGHSASADCTATVFTPQPTQADLTWSGDAGAEKQEWKWAHNWVGGNPPANPTTGRLTFADAGNVGDDSVTNLMDQAWTIGGFSVTATAGDHKTDLNGNKLTVNGRVDVGMRVAGKTAKIVNGSMQIGTPGSLQDLIVAGSGDYNDPVGAANFVLAGVNLTAYLNLCAIGYGSWINTPVGTLDLLDANVPLLRANRLVIAQGNPQVVGSVKLSSLTGLGEIRVRDSVVMATKGTARIGDPSNSWNLPPNVSITLGDWGISRCSMEVSTASDDHWADGRLVASSGGTFTAYLSTLKLAEHTGREFGYSEAGQAIATLDLSAMDHVTLDADSIQVAAPAPVVTPGGHNDGRGLLGLPPGTATVREAMIAHADVNDTNADPTCSAILRLNGTVFVPQSSLTVGPRGTVQTKVNGTSCGLDIPAGSAVAITGKISIIFELDPLTSGLYYGLRWAGDHTAELEALNVAGNLTWDDTVLTRPVSIFTQGGFTYVGQSVALAKVTSFTVADSTSGSSLITNQAAVTVAIAAEAAEGQAIDGYAVTETADPPAAWLPAISSYTITGPQGNVTLYGWVKDTAGNTGSATATIYFNSAGPVITAGPTVTNNGDGTATAVWTTDIPALGSINYGPATLAGTTPGSAAEVAVGTSHSVLLTGLSTATTNYKIVVVNTEVVSPAFFWPSMWPIPCDVNKDCKVNILDLISVRNKLNQPVSGENIVADVNLPAPDGKINILDLIAVRNKLNTQCP